MLVMLVQISWEQTINMFLVCLHGECKNDILCDNKHTWCFHKIIF